MGIDKFIKSSLSGSTATAKAIGGGGIVGEKGSNVELLFESKLLHGKETFRWAEKIVGTATAAHNATEKGVLMQVASTNDDSIRESKTNMVANVGGALVAFMSAQGIQAQTNVVIRVGLVRLNQSVRNPDGGVYYLSENGNQHNFVFARSGVETKIEQANWNGDKLDGTGASGATINFSNLQTIWFGVGTSGAAIECGFVVEGELIVCHTFYFNNKQTQNNFLKSNFPLTYQIRSTAAVSTTGIWQYGTAVYRLGGERMVGRSFGFNTGATTSKRVPVDGDDGAERVLIALRMIDGRENGRIRLKALTIYCDTDTAFAWSLIMDGTVTGSELSFTSIGNQNESIIEGARASITLNDNKITGGTGYLILSGYGNGKHTRIEGLEDLELPMTKDINSSRNELLLAVSLIDANDANFLGGLEWVEEY